MLGWSSIIARSWTLFFSISPEKQYTCGIVRLLDNYNSLTVTRFWKCSFSEAHHHISDQHPSKKGKNPNLMTYFEYQLDWWRNAHMLMNNVCPSLMINENNKCTHRMMKKRLERVEDQKYSGRQFDIHFCRECSSGW